MSLSVSKPELGSPLYLYGISSSLRGSTIRTFCQRASEPGLSQISIAFEGSMATELGPHSLSDLPGRAVGSGIDELEFRR